MILKYQKYINLKLKKNSKSFKNTYDTLPQYEIFLFL